MSKGQSKIFLDASVFIASAKSPNGGSALVLRICQKKKFQAVSTLLVLTEAQRNIKKKFSDVELIRFYQEIANLSPKIVKPATTKELSEYSRIIEPKDAHVLAAAVRSGATFLVTLDRKHFMTSTIRNSGLPINILTPGEFLRRIV